MLVIVIPRFQRVQPIHRVSIRTQFIFWTLMMALMFVLSVLMYFPMESRLQNSVMVRSLVYSLDYSD